MKKLTISLTDTEYDWVKKQGRGYTRRLVQADMVKSKKDLEKGSTTSGCKK